MDHAWHQAGAHRSPMNEQVPVILKVGPQPTACHKQEMLGKENRHDPVLKESIGWQIRVQNEHSTSRAQATGRPERTPLAALPWPWAGTQEEKG